MACPVKNPRGNPGFLPRSLFDRYTVRTMARDGQVSVDNIQTLSGAERKARDLARKYPCVGVEIVSAKHGTVVKSYKPATTPTAAPKVDRDNTRDYRREMEADRKNVRYVLYVGGQEFATYDTRREAESFARDKRVTDGKATRIKEVAGNPAERFTLSRYKSPTLVDSYKGWHIYKVNEDKHRPFHVFNTKNEDMGGYSNREDAEYDMYSGNPPSRNPLSRFRVTYRGQTFEIMASSRTAAERQVRAIWNGEAVVNPLGKNADGRVFPEYGGELLSWSIGSYMTHSESQRGYPKARAVIQAMAQHRPDQLERERREMLKASMSDRMFGHNAKKELDLIESVVGRKNPLSGIPDRDIPKLRHEGYPQRQAVAIAMSEQRRHGLANPAAKIDYVVTYWYANGTRNREYFTRRADAERQLRKYQRNHKGGHGEITTEPHLTVSQRQFGVRSNPTAGNIVEGTLPKVHYSMGQSNASLNRTLATRALKAGMTPEEIHTEWPRIWALSDGKLAQIYDSEFANHPGVYETKYSMANVPEIIARYKKLRGRRKNPEPDTRAAEQLFEDFHGFPSTGETVYETVEWEPDSYGQLGDLVEIKVATIHGKDITVAAPDPATGDLASVVKLAGAEDPDEPGTFKQLYFIGGNQGLDVTRMGFSSSEKRHHMLIGVLYELTYQTKKKFHKFKLTDYYHHLGEDTKNQPCLIYDPYSCRMAVVGGDYSIRPEGIVN